MSNVRLNSSNCPYGIRKLENGRFSYSNSTIIHLKFIPNREMYAFGKFAKMLLAITDLSSQEKEDFLLTID